MLSSPHHRRRLPLALDPFSCSPPPPHLGMRNPSRTKATGRSTASSSRSPPRAGEAEGGAADGDLNGWEAVPAVEYADESIMIPKNTSVLIRRKPGRPRMPIVTEPEQAIAAENRVEEIMPSGSAFLGDSSMKYPEESEWDDEFSNSLYVSDSIPSQPASQAIDASSENQIDEDSKIKALIDTAAVDYRVLNRNMKKKS